MVWWQTLPKIQPVFWNVGPHDFPGYGWRQLPKVTKSNKIYDRPSSSKSDKNSNGNNSRSSTSISYKNSNDENNNNDA